MWSSTVTGFEIFSEPIATYSVELIYVQYAA